LEIRRTIKVERDLEEVSGGDRVGREGGREGGRGAGGLIRSKREREIGERERGSAKRKTYPLAAVLYIDKSCFFFLLPPRNN
jgi:hypothetical protein